MRIVLDLQAAQSESWGHGIGRHSLTFAQAIAREARDHEIWLALSGNFADSIEPLRSEFAELIPPKRVRVFELPGSVAEILASSWRIQAAELVREKFLADLRPDIVHVSTLFEGFHNGVVASVGRLSKMPPTAVTLYDPTPVLHPERFVDDQMIKSQCLRCAQSLKRANLLLATSDSLRREAIDALQISPERICTIGAGWSRSSFRASEVPGSERASILASYGLHRAFVLSIGAAEEAHKNLEGLIIAFALLPEKVQAVTQLAIVSELSENVRRRLATVAKEHHLKEDQLVCPGYVPEEDLRLLNASCSAFVSPSLHGQSGLPVLEAMADGAPVIGSNCNAISEIINRKDALFDPRQPQVIANRLADVLLNTDLRQSLKEWGPERAKAFTWAACARKALQAFEELHAKRKNGYTKKLSTAPPRPLLGFVSPLPPERTGIAGYSARLLPNLARHYEITCIINQPTVRNPWISAEFVVRDVEWFKANGATFDRVVYNFGNSQFHEHMLTLIERHPGVVVLHDFYLGCLLNWVETYSMRGCFTKALYDSHGFSALEKDQSSGREAATKTYPCNASLLRDSVGVIVHSEHALELARKLYGDQVLTFMRPIPFLPFPPEAADRLAARTRLVLPENAFVVCSFGFLTPLKLSHRLLDCWLASPLSQDETCFLIFVGENHGGDYRQRLVRRIEESSAEERIRITDYVEELHYRDYLAASDLAVQLRVSSRGETSAAIFDCLSRNVPLVVNAHGSATELPNDAVMKLRDEFADEELSTALTRLRSEPNLRQNLADRGALYLKERHHPERIAELYRDTIEELYDTSSVARERTLLQAIVRTSATKLTSDSDLAAVASAIAANRQRFGPNQILIDVTNVATSDLRTGIERVTRGILVALISDPPPGYRIEPIRAVGDGYVYARHFACRCLALAEEHLADDPVETGDGDIFIGMDWCAHVVPSLAPWFKRHRRHGMRIVFTIYDLLPVLQPQMFPPEIEPRVRHWLDALTLIADGLICISRTVADELLDFLRATRHHRHLPLRVGFFHLGADLRASLPTEGLRDSDVTIIADIRARPSFLMVGTVEPRKGHRQALAAMEHLWADGIDVNLVIVGKKGWMMNDLAEQIEGHPELNNRLFWLREVSDEMLDQIYRSAHALLAASEGEGFGLPLIEAAQHSVPIIARDIPVFVEVAGEHAYYFHGKKPEDLADALRTWLSLGDAVPASKDLSRLNWQQSSRQLLDVVLRDRWYGSWPEAANSLSAITISRTEGALEPVKKVIQGAKRQGAGA